MILHKNPAKPLLIILLCLLFFQISISNAQNRGFEETNRGFLLEFAQIQKTIFEENKLEAIQLATEMGWPLRQELEDGTVMEIMKIDEFGMPVYYITGNTGAAETSSTQRLHPGDTLGYNLSGKNMTLGIWDGGAVRVTHQELSGRATQVDSATPISHHATHVGGTMIASGVSSGAKGMSFEADLDAYDWNLDVTEMSTASSNGLLISNHSYGSISGWQWGNWSGGSNAWHWWGYITQYEDYKFGWYNSTARNFDIIMWNAPYYLIIKSAGNNRSNNGPSSPLDTYYVLNTSNAWIPDTTSRSPNNSYNIIPTYGNAKNILTVGAVTGISGGYSVPADVQISSFSSWGPTDDGRIKPDLVAQGVGLFSPVATHNTAYATFSGTSMSAPAISGSLLLLQQLYDSLNNQYLRSASLKGLAIHSADEAGNSPGPDYIYGWGLLNTLKAAEVIINKGGKHLIIEEELSYGKSFSSTFYVGGSEPLIATLCWTDPPGTATTGTVSNVLNNIDIKLVHDLDLRITFDSNTYYPFILDPANPADTATNGDNIRDNVEKIIILNPDTGLFTFTVSHKDTLLYDQQFSLIISGIGNSISTLPFSNSTFCTGDSLLVEYVASGPFDTNNVFTAQLSDENGSFSTPFNIGSITSTVSGKIPSIIPATIVPGNKYRIRVVSSSPVVSEVSNNGFDLILDTIPIANIKITGNNSFCTSDSVLLESENNSVSYQWVKDGNIIQNETSKQLYVNSSGQFQLINVNTAGCADTSSIVEVTVFTLPDTTVNVQNSTSGCKGDSILMTAVQNNTWSYQWYRNDTLITGASNFELAAFQTANYHVLITDTNNCTSNSSVININIYPLPSDSVYITGNTTFCNGDSVLLEASSGSGYTYQWYRNDTSISQASNIQYYVKKSGDYKVQLTNNNNCQNISDPATIIVNSSPQVTISSNNSLAFCDGDSILLQANAVSGLTYQWYRNNNLITGANSNQFSVSIQGNYYVKVTDSNSCENSSNVLSVTVFDNPNVQANAMGLTGICTGDSVLIQTTQETTYTYQWQHNNTDITNATTYQYYATLGGDYKVLVNDTNGCSETTNVVTVTIYSLPLASIIAKSDPAFCKGDSVLLESNTSTAFNYQWFLNGSEINAAVNFQYYAFQSGEYNVRITDSNGCIGISNEISVTVYDNPVAEIIAQGPVAFCEGDSLLIQANTGISLNYQWKLNDTIIPGINDADLFVYTSGDYKLIVTDSNNCSSVSNSINITIFKLPEANINPLSATTFCDGDEVILEADDLPNQKYQWYKDGNEISGAINYQFTVLNSGSYFVKVIDDNNCKELSNTMEVTVYELPEAKIQSTGTTAFCDGDSVIFEAAQHNDHKYDWYLNNTLVQSGITPFYTAFQTGDIHIKVTDTNACTNVSASLFIEVYELPAAEISTVGPLAFCDGDSVILEANTGNDLTYQWLKNDSILNGQTAQLLSVYSEGLYSLLVKETEHECINLSEDIFIEVNQLPEVKLGMQGKDQFCRTDSVILNTVFDSEYDYQWFRNDTLITDANEEKIHVFNSGDYYVYVETQEECSNYSEIQNITVYELPPVPLISQTGNTLHSSSNSGNQWYDENGIINGAEQDTFVPDSDGNYYIIITDTNGCTSQSELYPYKTTGIPKIKYVNNFNIYPNPSKGIFNISHEHPEAVNINAIVFDVWGKILLVNDLNFEKNMKNFKIDLSEYTSGVYILLLQNNSHSQHFRIIKTE